MTIIKVERYGSVYKLEASNHTDSKVCAGISALLQALEGWILNNPEHTMDRHIRLESGHASFSFRGDSEAEAVFWCIYIGLKRIELGYRDQVTIFDHT